jgi:hypothetical protein
MAPGRVCPQNSSRPAASVITSALTVLARALPETNRVRPALWAAGRRTRTSVASSRPTCLLAPKWATTSARLRSRIPPSTVQPRSASSGRTSPTARVIVERETPNQQASTSCVTPWRRCTRVASSRSMNTSRCRAPAPTARCRGLSASRASWHACQRGPSSTTSSARTCGDSPVTRRSATAAARASVLDTRRPCSVRHEQPVPLTMHEVVRLPDLACPDCVPVQRPRRSSWRRTSRLPRPRVAA